MLGACLVIMEIVGLTKQISLYVDEKEKRRGYYVVMLCTFTVDVIVKRERKNNSEKEREKLK